MKHLDIKRALADHNITQVQLGEKLGLSPQSLTSVIKGNPTVKKLEDIAIAIGCDITDLFYPDPAEEAEEKEKKKMVINMNPLGMGVVENISGRLPDVIGGKRENVNWDSINEASDGIAGNGGEMEQGTTIQTSTFCPHCGKKVRVGVVLLPDE